MYKMARQIIIDMILATEMTRHFEHLAKFVSVFGTDVEPKDVSRYFLYVCFCRDSAASFVTLFLGNFCWKTQELFVLQNFST